MPLLIVPTISELDGTEPRRVWTLPFSKNTVEDEFIFSFHKAKKRKWWVCSLRVDLNGAANYCFLDLFDLWICTQGLATLNDKYDYVHTKRHICTANVWYRCFMGYFYWWHCRRDRTMRTTDR